MTIVAQHTKTPKLAPCPFCGRLPIKAHRAPIKTHDGARSPLERKWTVRCTDGTCPGLNCVWFDSQEEAIRAWTRRFHVGSTSRMIETLVGMVLAGDPWKQAVDQWEWEWGRGPDLSSLQAIVELRETVRAFLNTHKTDMRYWTMEGREMAKALRRADRAAGRSGK